MSVKHVTRLPSLAAALFIVRRHRHLHPRAEHLLLQPRWYPLRRRRVYPPSKVYFRPPTSPSSLPILAATHGLYHNPRLQPSHEQYPQRRLDSLAAALLTSSIASGCSRHGRDAHACCGYPRLWPPAPPLPPPLRPHHLLFATIARAGLMGAGLRAALRSTRKLIHRVIEVAQVRKSCRVPVGEKILQMSQSSKFDAQWPAPVICRLLPAALSFNCLQ